MSVSAIECWKLDKEQGYKAWFGFAVVTETELIFFKLRNKKAKLICGGYPGEIHPSFAKDVMVLVERGRTRALRRFDRASVTAVASLVKAKRFRVEMGDDVQHISGAYSPDALVQATGRISAALFPGQPALRETVSASGAGAWQATLAPVAIAVVAASIVIGLTVVADPTYDGRRAVGQWLNDFFIEVPMPAAIAVAAALIIGAALISARTARNGYEAITWRPNGGRRP